MATNGADVIAYKDNEKYVIQVKFYNNPVGNKAVQEVVGAIGMYKADKGIVVTNSTFTSSAIELAQANNIELINGDKIEKYKKQITNNINMDTTDKSELEIYIDNICERANLIIEKIDKNDEKAFQKMIASFGQTYVTLEGENYYNSEKINRFIDGFFKYCNLEANGEKFDLTENRDIIETLLKAGICSIYITDNIMDSILNDDSLYEDEKMETINIRCNEYINDESDIMDKASKLFALQIFYKFSENTDDENIDNNILEYDDYNDFDNNYLDYDDDDYNDFDDLDD